MAYMPSLGPRPNVRPSPPYFDPTTNQPAWNPFSDRDVFNQYQNIGRNQYQQSQDWQSQFGGMANYYGDASTGYGNVANDLYNPIWGGGGGYTPEMQQNLLQSQGLQDVQDQLPGNYLTGDEQTNILGNPYSAKDFYGGQAPMLMGQANAIGDQMRQSVGWGQDATGGAYGTWDKNAYGALNSGVDNSQGVLSGMRSGYDSAIDPTALSVSQGYQPGIDSALQNGESQVGTAQSDPGLNITGDYLKQAGMTDQEVADTALASARDTGAQYGAIKDELRQRAAASGTATPLGIAAAEQSLTRQGGAAQTDALLNARLQARQAQRNAATGVQGMQLNAGQYRAGLRSKNAMDLEKSRLAALTGAEQLRLGANSNLAGMRMSATHDLGAAGLANNQYLTQAGIGLAGQLGQSRINNDQYFTGEGVNVADRAGQYNLGTANNIANHMTDLTQQGEQAVSNRFGNVALNRQGVAQGNQQTQLGINGATAQRYQAAYSPWLQAQQEGRRAALEQQQYYGGQANQQNQFRLGGWQTGNQGQLGAAGGYSGWGSTGGQGFGDYFSKALGNTLGGGNTRVNVGLGHAHGGLIKQHQLIEVGEHDRPEAILPLDPATPPDRRNQWERMGANLGRAMGLHPRRFATGGVIGLDSPNAFSSQLKAYDDMDDSGDNGYDIPGYAEGGVVGALPEVPMAGPSPHGAGGALPTAPTSMPSWYDPSQNNPWGAQAGFGGGSGGRVGEQVVPQAGSWDNPGGQGAYGAAGQFNAAGYGTNPNAPPPPLPQRNYTPNMGVRGTNGVPGLQGSYQPSRNPVLSPRPIQQSPAVPSYQPQRPATPLGNAPQNFNNYNNPRQRNMTPVQGGQVQAQPTGRWNATPRQAPGQGGGFSGYMPQRNRSGYQMGMM